MMHENEKTDQELLGWELRRLVTHLMWIDEHLWEHEQVIDADQQSAQNELRRAADSCKQATDHLYRTLKLLGNGVTLDLTSIDLDEALRDLAERIK